MKELGLRFVIRCYVIARGWLYRLRKVAGRPVEFRVAETVKIALFPEGQIAELLYTSRFERRDLELVSRFLRPGMKVIDVGANIGLYSILADRCVSPGGRVWAFEPSGESRDRLLRNLKLNQVSTVLTAGTALSDKAGEDLNLARDNGRGDGERFLVAGEACLPESNQQDIELVPVTTLDYYFFIESSSSWENIDFLKIDIEGGELLVFRGARKLLTANPKIVIMFESTPGNANRYGYTQDDLFQFLREFGFNLYCWDRDKSDWTNNEDMLWLAGNIWATRDRSSLPQWSDGR
ncbi:MAG: FkbM family methyltransferase, partial [Acidobacteria bacterium]|nr:FkbM family methyltransferase [Acidobacteriota bacterium]